MGKSNFLSSPFERMPPKDIERAECPNCKGSGYVEDSKGNSKNLFVAMEQE